ncbi:hypothetical protein OG883_16600 [Streptomyces sp. NBC_01142]|uniref:hypothetical protein n=1 Tax=Streptomyces sp. NBC_01142 TaxID=2975865 RepID=UPI0022590B04|nr:hypothetical protein [Streptomyces sp. NBC_01142]MCX4821488.1 hypothetical protein [Streptomyces sp. NBC_01142]
MGEGSGRQLPTYAHRLRAGLDRRPEPRRRSARLGAVGQLPRPSAVLLRDTAARLTRATLRSMTQVLGWTAPGDRVTATESESH